MIPALVCIAKLEQPYIEEFVQYHLKLGFAHIVLYDNEDVPTYAAMLSAYPQVRVIHLPGNSYHKAVQYVALDDFCANHLREFTHVAHIDVDEFIALKRHANIRDFIDEFIVGDCGGIGMNWRFFGDSGHAAPTAAPVTHRFTRCAAQGDQHVKTLFKTEHFAAFSGCHAVTLTSGHIKTTQGVVFDGPFSPPDVSVIQLNHYKCKTLPEFQRARTRQRADVQGETHENVTENFHIYNHNEEEDLTACTFFKT